MHTQYKLTNLYASTTDTLRTEQGRTARKSGYYSLHKKKKEVGTVVAFMQETINAIRFKVFQVYTGETNKDNPNYLYSLTPKFEKYTDKSVMLIKDIKPLAEKWMEDYQTNYWDMGEGCRNSSGASRLRQCRPSGGQVRTTI